MIAGASDQATNRRKQTASHKGVCCTAIGVACSDK